jgi:hypothetical protein
MQSTPGKTLDQSSKVYIINSGSGREGSNNMISTPLEKPDEQAEEWQKLMDSHAAYVGMVDMNRELFEGSIRKRLREMLPEKLKDIPDDVSVWAALEEKYRHDHEQQRTFITTQIEMAFRVRFEEGIWQNIDTLKEIANVIYTDYYYRVKQALPE